MNKTLSRAAERTLFVVTARTAGFALVRRSNLKKYFTTQIIICYDPAMRISQLTVPVAGLLCAAAMGFLGYFELHTDDTGVEVAALGACAFFLGCLDPRRAWLWPLLVAASIPGAELLFGKAGIHGGLLGVAAFVLAVSLIAGLTGAFARRMFFPVATVK